MRMGARAADRATVVSLSRGDLSGLQPQAAVAQPLPEEYAHAVARGSAPVRRPSFFRSLSCWVPLGESRSVATANTLVVAPHSLKCIETVQGWVCPRLRRPRSGGGARACAGSLKLRERVIRGGVNAFCQYWLYRFYFSVRDRVSCVQYQFSTVYRATVLMPLAGSLCASF